MRFAAAARAADPCSRGQLYLPADLMQRYGAQTADCLAGKATTELRAVLAELRLRRGSISPRAQAAERPRAEVLPRCLPVALVRPRSTAWSGALSAVRADRSAAMAAAMGAVARGAHAAKGVDYRLDYSAAMRACRRSTVRGREGGCVPHRALLAAALPGTSQPRAVRAALVGHLLDRRETARKLTFIGWYDRRALHRLVSTWISGDSSRAEAPCAGGSAAAAPRGFAAPLGRGEAAGHQARRRPVTTIPRSR
jgi:hypothetical protein